MAQITAERLMRHLALSGFVVMKRPPAAAPERQLLRPGQQRVGWPDQQKGPQGVR